MLRRLVGSEICIIDRDKRGKVDTEVYNTASVYVKLKIIAGNIEIEAILFDNQTSRSVAEMLPLTIEIWQPALGFASAFDLPQSFPYFEQEPPQRGYELGSLAYWMPGPSIAMIYNDDRYQTVVPVVPIGKINGDIRFLESYEGTITIEAVE